MVRFIAVLMVVAQVRAYAAPASPPKSAPAPAPTQAPAPPAAPPPTSGFPAPVSPSSPPAAPTNPAPAPSTPPGTPTTPAGTPTTPPQASPAPEAPADPNVDEAKRHFEQGVALFNDGNFSAALSEFEQVYRLHPVAGVLYNIGVTQKALFRYPEAIDSLQRFLLESKSATPEQRAECEQLIRGMKALLADVTLTVVPDNATISVDGRPMGTSPLTKPLQIAAGTHKIEVTADGYEPQKQDVMVTAEVPLTRTFTLKLIPKTGKIRISSTMGRVTVTVDGTPRGYAPLEVELDAGGHLIETTAPDFESRRDEVVIAAGQTRELPVTLVKVVHHKKAWYSHWYVWTGIGAVLVGGTGACALAGCFDTSQSPYEGTLSPGVGTVQ